MIRTIHPHGAEPPAPHEEADSRSDARQRIYDAAIDLFARKGYNGVGVRELARTAGVQLSMIDYYFGGKLAILKAILQQYQEMYQAALKPLWEDEDAAEERTRRAVRNVVQFFRDHTALAMVALNSLVLDIPEIHDMRLGYVADRRESMNAHYRRMGLNPEDIAAMSTVRGALTTLIAAHFRSRFVREHIIGSPDRLKRPEARMLATPPTTYDDAFYDRYCSLLVDFYLRGIAGLTRRNGALHGGGGIGLTGVPGTDPLL
jgi:AcrR family transcriptional regulator